MQYAQVIRCDYGNTEKMQLSYFPPEQILHIRVLQALQDLISHLNPVSQCPVQLFLHLPPKPCLPVACSEFGVELVPCFDMLVPVNLVLIEKVSQFIGQCDAFDVVAAEIGMDVWMRFAEVVAAQQCVEIPA